MPRKNLSLPDNIYPDSLKNCLDYEQQKKSCKDIRIIGSKFTTNAKVFAQKPTLFLRLKKLGYHLIRVKLIKLHEKKTLQIMAERIKDKKMNIEDCVFLSKHISTFLEVDDPISSSYDLEVSSGGLARPLTLIDDYESFKNNKAKIVLKEKFL